VRFLTVLCVFLLLGEGGKRALANNAGSPEEGWLEWLPGEGGESCPNAAAFMAKVEEHLGASPATTAQHARVLLRARIQHQNGAGARWTAEAQIVNSAGDILGSRTISNDSDTCGSVSDALALVSALILANPPIATPPPQPIAAPIPTATVAIPSPKPRWSAGLAAGPSVSVGMLPGAGLAGELQVLLVPPVGPGLYAGFVFWPQSKATLAGQQGAAIRAWIATLGICPFSWSSDSRQLDLCAGGELGRMHASGFGFVSSSSSDRWILDLTGGAQGRQRIAGGWFVQLGVRLVVPLLRNRVAYANVEGTPQRVFEMGSVAAVGHLGLGFAFR
jgi:hypothetical protein